MEVTPLLHTNKYQAWNHWHDVHKHIGAYRDAAHVIKQSYMAQHKGYNAYFHGLLAAVGIV